MAYDKKIVSDYFRAEADAAYASGQGMGGAWMDALKRIGDIRDAMGPEEAAEVARQKQYAARRAAGEVI